MPADDKQSPSELKRTNASLHKQPVSLFLMKKKDKNFRFE